MTKFNFVGVTISQGKNSPVKAWQVLANDANVIFLAIFQICWTAAQG